MKTLWHPLSTILLTEPPSFATDGLVRMRAETTRAGVRIEPWQAGHAVLTVEPTAMIRS